MERVYIIKTDLTPEKNDEIISSFDENLLNRVKISGKNTINIDELETDGYLTSYLIGDDNDIELINEISEKYGVNILIHDITDNFLNGDIDIDFREFVEYRKNKMR